MRQRAMIGVVFVVGISIGARYRADVLPDAVSVWDVGAKEQLYVTPR